MKSNAAIDSFIERGGLILLLVSVTDLQALVNRIPCYGNFEDASSTSPTLSANDANQHVLKIG